MTERPLLSLGFEDWVEHVFGHAVETSKPAWYNEPDCWRWEAPAEDKVATLARLFEDPVPPLDGFADSQIAQGLMYLVHNGASDYVLSLAEAKVPAGPRLACVRSIHTLFAKLLDPRCTPTLSHLDEPGAGPLNGICYMWWDIFPGMPAPADPARGELDTAYLDAMARTLALPSPACQESALHGLGHWRGGAGRDQAGAIIDGYLAGKGDTLRPELARYAAAARSGCIQ
jgi:hypothetical protein